MQLIKIKKGLIFIFGLTIISFTNCKDQKAEQEKLQTDVMLVHDSLMMDMGKLTEKRMMLTKLTSNLDSLKKIDTSLDTTQIKTDIADQKLALSNADDAMMKWMNGFNPDYTGKSQEEIIKYLKQKKKKK
jgi:hypothetical protein